MNLCKNLLEFKEMELKLLEKSNTKYSNHNPLQYLKWFLKNSEQFTQVNKELSEKVSIEVQAKIKECYHNTWKASWNRKFKYYEGYVWSKHVPIPLEHSWLTSNDKIIEPTLIIPNYVVKKQIKKYGVKDFEGRHFDNDEYEYVGVHIPTKILNKFVFKAEKTGGFIIQYFMSQGQELIVTG